MLSPSPVCPCGHDPIFHDAHGCAAFLGAFAETAPTKRYCACRRVARVVANVTLRERAGRAIAVCEAPEALELGRDAERVLTAIKERLRAAFPHADGIWDRIHVRFEGLQGSVVRVESLR